MYSTRKIILLSLSLLLAAAAFSQTRFSIATDFGVQRSLKKGQSYWAIGQTVIAQIHLTPKDGGYAWFTYYSYGKFSNKLVATAKSPATTPQELGYTNNTTMTFNHISLGWKHYIKGTFNSEEQWNAYTLAGLGILMGRVINTHSTKIDSADYTIPVWAGRANFKRLTLDLGLGIEKPVGGDVFLYGEAKTIIPVSYFPSNYILDSKYTPLTACMTIGVRVLF